MFVLKSYEMILYSLHSFATPHQTLTLLKAKSFKH